MFEELKKLWSKGPLVTEKPTVVKTNISEPIISFVNAVKKDPKRFTINKVEEGYDGVSKACEYSIIDKKLDKSFSCRLCVFTDYEHGINYNVTFIERKVVRGKSEPWLTNEEVLYVIKELEDFFKEKVERVKSKIEKRARERLTKLYKGE